MFLQIYENAPDYDFLNKLICQWRAVEEQTRAQCGLPSVTTDYAGCFPYRRGWNTSSATANTTSTSTTAGFHDSEEGRRLRSVREGKPVQRGVSAHDLILHNARQAEMHGDFFEPKRLLMHASNFDPPDPNFDWDEFIQSQLQQEEERSDPNHRQLIDYHNVGPWFNYFPMIGVKTEYYFRYGGTQTVPPCFGYFTPNNNRANTNAWRVMKDPIRVSYRQINELHRLLKERIAPADDPLRACQHDTAAKPYEGNSNWVNVTRPLQSTNKAHFMTFCPCQWKSKWWQDRVWCELDLLDRLYYQPYNFKTDGF